MGLPPNSHQFGFPGRTTTSPMQLTLWLQYHHTITEPGQFTSQIASAHAVVYAPWPHGIARKAGLTLHLEVGSLVGN